MLYEISPVSLAGCRGDTIVLAIPIDPEPVLANLNTVICGSDPVSVTLAVAGGSVGAANYNIVDIRNGGLTPGGSNSSVGDMQADNAIFMDTWENTGGFPVVVEYDVSPVSGLMCRGDTATIQISVNPEPVLARSRLPVYR